MAVCLIASGSTSQSTAVTLCFSDLWVLWYWLTIRLPLSILKTRSMISWRRAASGNLSWWPLDTIGRGSGIYWYKVNQSDGGKYSKKLLTNFPLNFRNLRAGTFFRLTTNKNCSVRKFFRRCLGKKGVLHRSWHNCPFFFNKQN